MTTAEWTRAKKLLPHIEEAATRFGLDPALILAVLSRESRCGLALDASGKGDGGHGHGLGQIDDRSHAAFIQANNWRDPRTNILYSARVLRDSIKYCTTKGAADPVRAGVAGYNCGPGRVMQAIRQGRDMDHYTAHRDYSADVLRRREWFAKKLAANNTKQ